MEGQEEDWRWMELAQSHIDWLPLELVVLNLHVLLP